MLLMSIAASVFSQNARVGDLVELVTGLGPTLAEVIVAPDASGYVNFINHEGADAVKSAYPAATYERLRAVKRQYDPQNLFWLNQNIRP